MKNTVMLMIQESRFKELKNIVDKINVVDIADLFELLSKEQIIIVFRILNKESAAEVFSYLDREHQQFIIESISDREINNIIEELFIDDTVDFLEEMPANVVSRVLKTVDNETRKLINLFLAYPDNSAGSLMTIEMVDLRKEMTVQEAIEYIKKNGVDKETINNCYVINRFRRLEGTVSIRRLILSDYDTLIEDIMDTDVVKINTYDDQEDIAELFKKYDYTTMPVVDKENCLVGIITIDDIVDIIEQENTEDFQIMAAITPSEEVYIKTPVFTLFKNRIVWLLILMVSATLSGAIISGFDNILAANMILASFIPMLMDTGGNAGSQASTMVIRSIALGEVVFKDLFRIVWKEFRVSLLVGSSLAIVNFLRILLFKQASPIIASIVCISLFLTVVMAKFLGGLLPLCAKKLKLDPAIMASPFITTLVDAMSLTVFFSLSVLLLDL
ncbi:MAG: magnesium transporter [Candidatus Cloacimonetes bacterium]|nr:magnesium transporter [Candidatus Cloacimonadota bacterium]